MPGRRWTHCSAWPRDDLHAHGDAHAAADAERGDAAAETAVAERVHESHQDACARRAHRVAESHRAAVHVHAGGVDLGKLAQHAQGLRREGLVQLPEVHVGMAPAELLHEAGDGAGGAEAHVGRLETCRGRAGDARQRTEAPRLHAALRRQHQRGATVVDVGGVARRDGAVLLEGGPQLRERIEARGLRVLVGVEAHGIAALRLDLEGHDLLAELPGRLGLQRLLVARRREGVLLLPGDAVPLGHVLGGHAHVDPGDGAREPVHEQVHHLAVAHAVARARVEERVGDAVHALHPTGHEQVGLAEADRLGREFRGLHPRAAGLVDGEGRDRIGKPGRESGHAGRADLVARLQHIAHRHLLDLAVLPIYFGAFSAARFVFQLYNYGHNLDPSAPIRMEGFTPAIFGTKQIANFTTSSYPRGATFLIGAFATTVALVALWHVLRPPPPIRTATTA